MLTLFSNSYFAFQVKLSENIMCIELKLPGTSAEFSLRTGTSRPVIPCRSWRVRNLIYSPQKAKEADHQIKLIVKACTINFNALNISLLICVNVF